MTCYEETALLRRFFCASRWRLKSSQLAVLRLYFSACSGCAEYGAIIWMFFSRWWGESAHGADETEGFSVGARVYRALAECRGCRFFFINFYGQFFCSKNNQKWHIYTTCCVSRMASGFKCLSAASNTRRPHACPSLTKHQHEKTPAISRRSGWVSRSKKVEFRSPEVLREQQLLVPYGIAMIQRWPPSTGQDSIDVNVPSRFVLPPY